MTDSKNYRNKVFFLFLLGLIFTLNSCSSFKAADKHVDKRFKKAGLIEKVDRIADLQIHYWDSANDKPPLVLIHGFGAAARFQWYKQLKAFSDNYRIIVPNLLYFGQSKPTNSSKYQLKDQVDLVRKLLEHLNISSFNLCGVSYGGLVSAELAKTVPNHIRKLILFDTPVRFFSSEDVNAISEQYDVRDFIHLFAPEDPETLKKLLQLAYYNPPFAPKFALKDFHKNMYKPNLEHLRELLRSLHKSMDEFADHEYKFPFPTLLIWGAKDDVIPLKTGLQLNQYMNHSELHIISKTKHMPNLEKPKEFNQIVLNFLNSEKKQ